MKTKFFSRLLLAVFFPLGHLAAQTASEEELRIGLIGLDTSHVIAFTQLLNNPDNTNHVPGGRVVAAYKGGSSDIDASSSRIDGFTDRLQNEFGVEIIETIAELCNEVDVILLTSVDGRTHLEQVRPVFEAGLPVFIDKPVAGSLADAIEIYRLAEEYDVPVFSSSSLRFYSSLTDLKNTDVGELRGAISTGPASIEPSHPDLFWYGVHATEALFTVMGIGCETVVRTHTADTDVVTGVWSNGSVGTFRGIRNARAPFRVTLFGSDAVADQQGGGGYAQMLHEIMIFFQTGTPPVSPEETIEIFAFMEAADESKRQGGKPVRIQDILRKHGGGEN